MNKIGSDKELLVYLQKTHGGKSMTIGRAVRHILTFNWVFIYYEAMLLIGYLNQDCISTLEVPYGLKFRIHQIIKFVLLTFWIRTKRSHWQGKGISGMHFSWCHPRVQVWLWWVVNPSLPIVRNFPTERVEEELLDIMT